MNSYSVLYKFSLLRLSLQRVTKQSEVCHWIVSVAGEISTCRNLQVFLKSPSDPGLKQAIDFTRFLSAQPLIGTNSSQLHVQEPEELNFVEQNPRTMGGPGDLTHTAFPSEEDPSPSEALASVTGALFVLS